MLTTMDCSSLIFLTRDSRVFVTATMADRSPPDLYLFRNYPSPQSQLGIANYDHPGMYIVHIANITKVTVKSASLQS